MSRIRGYLPPKNIVNIEWDVLHKKNQIEYLKPKEICPRRTHSFHTSSTDHDRSIHNKSFDKTSYDNDQTSKKMQNEFTQLKQIIQKRKSELEQYTNTKLPINRDDDLVKQQNNITQNNNSSNQDLNYYQTFKPIFQQLNNIVGPVNPQIQTKLTTIFDSIEMESNRSTTDQEQLVNLVETIIKELKTNQRQFVNIQLNMCNLVNTLEQIKKSLGCQLVCGYMNYSIVNKIIYSESITNFNINKQKSCKLIDLNFQGEQQVDIPFKYFKQSLIKMECTNYNTITIIPISVLEQKIIFILNNCNSTECQQLQKQLQYQASQKRIHVQHLLSKIQKANSSQLAITIIRLKQFGQQSRKLKQFYLRYCLNRIRQQYAKIEQYSQNNLLPKLILQSAHQVKKNLKYNGQQLSQILSNFYNRRQQQAFSLISNYNYDQMIMLQSLQNEPSLDTYLQQLYLLLGDKLIVTVLNTEVQSITAYLPEYGIIQEFFDQIEDLSQFDTLNLLTQSIDQILQENSVIFEYRHIWQVQNDLFIITLSNMNTHYLSKLALIITNGVVTLRQKYLTFFRSMQHHQDNYQMKCKFQAFMTWKQKQHIQLLKQEQELTNKGSYQLQMEIQNLHIQNDMKSKCLSSALLENILTKRESITRNSDNYFQIWQLKTKEMKHLQARYKTALYLVEIFTSKLCKSKLDLAFREIALASYGQAIESPHQFKPKTREPTRRSQDDIEQSVLWDIHQMRVFTPNANHSFSPNQTINTSLQLNETDPIYQFHSQRTQQCVSSKSNQENQQNQNKIYSQRTKDFVKKLSKNKSNHQRFNSTQQPGSSFSFYDKFDIIN